MRIIGGFLKGRKIFDVVDKSTRPLKDMVRESIFNILDHSKNEGINFNKSKILDLFSGTGSFGLECISRGASKVIFFENYKQSYEILIENINKLNCINETIVYEKNAYDFFDISEVKKGEFDLVFLDPPFKDCEINKLIQNIKNFKIIKKKGIIVIHRNKKTKENISKSLKILRIGNYGNSKIIFGKIN